MKIKWTPLFDVPMHNRLEVLGVTLYMLCLTIIGPICGIVILYSLVKIYRLKCSVSKFLVVNKCKKMIIHEIIVAMRKCFYYHNFWICWILGKNTQNQCAQIKFEIAMLWKYLLENYMRNVFGVFVVWLEFKRSWWTWCWVCILHMMQPVFSSSTVNFVNVFGSWNKFIYCFRVSWVRNLSIWKHFLNYFPVDLIKTADLPSDRNYLICICPHGLLK